MGWDGRGGSSTKGVCSVHLVDGCCLVSGHGGNMKICPRLVLDWAGINTASLEFAT